MLTEPDLSDGDAKMTLESKYALLVQAPPCLRREGWIELDEMPVAASYVLDHITFASSAYLYDRATVEQLVGPHGLQPLMKLPLRFPRQYFVDKMMFTLRSCPDGWRSYEPAAAGQPAFGFYAKCWYNLMDLKPQGGTRLIIEHSPDWCARRVYRCFWKSALPGSFRRILSVCEAHLCTAVFTSANRITRRCFVCDGFRGASWDAWLGVFLLQYKRVCGDEDGFCAERYSLIHAGFSSLDWNVKAPGCAVDGAWWQCWSKDKGFHAAMFIKGGVFTQQNPQ